MKYTNIIRVYLLKRKGMRKIKNNFFTKEEEADPYAVCSSVLVPKFLSNDRFQSIDLLYRK